MDELAGVNDWLVSVAKVGRAYANSPLIPPWPPARMGPSS